MSPISPTEVGLPEKMKKRLAQLSDILIQAVRSHRGVLILSISISLAWLFISSIGGFGYKHFDSHIIDTRFWHIVNEPWSIWFDAEYLGMDEDKPFVFYFAYYLPAALVGKVFGWTAANIALFCWSWLCLFVVLSLIGLYASLSVYKIGFLFLGVILFGGLDFAFNFMTKMTSDRSEMWSMPFFFFSNTRMLFWSPHHVLPAWLFAGIILHLRSLSPRVLSLISIPLVSVTLWSPLSLISLLPFAAILLIYLVREHRGSIFSTYNFLSAILFFILASFILSNQFSFPLEWSPSSFSGFWMRYPVFLLVELGASVLITLYGFKLLSPFEQELTMVSFLWLLLIPFIRLGIWNDWCIKNAIVPVFLLSVITGLIIIRSFRFRYFSILMIAMLAISWLTAIEELNYSVQNFQISFQKPPTFNQLTKGYVVDQQLGKPDSFFIKYLAIRRKNNRGEWDTW